MFSTFKQRLLLGVYIFIILSIPVGSYLASQNQIFKSKASEPSKNPIAKTTTKSATSAAKELLSSSESNLVNNPPPAGGSSPSPTSTSPTIATSFGPTLSLKARLEGRPEGNWATKLFVGIFEGIISSNPKFILSFSVDLPAAGTYSNLSLAGLTSGNKYTALLKGSAQIATSSAFIMSPTVTNLNSGEVLNMLSGDLNEDNVINSADYSIAQRALGATARLANWNGNADFNLDGLINTFDLAIITKNMGQTGASGAWTSPIPKVATRSASLDNTSSQGGYWLWLPK